MKFLLCALLLAAVEAACLRQAPRDQKHVQQGQQSLSWLPAFLDSTVDRDGCGHSCGCPYRCACELKDPSADLDDYDDVDDVDIWELNTEEPHGCCGCVCGCYNKAAADKIKKFEAQKKIAQQVAAQEKVAADHVAIEKKNRAEIHIQRADVSAKQRITQAEAAKQAAIINADIEIATARHDVNLYRAKEEIVIMKADEVNAHDKWVANNQLKTTIASLDAKIAETQKIAAEKKAQELQAYEEKKRLEKVAKEYADVADDKVLQAETALKAAKVKYDRAVAESLAAEKDAECYKTCVEEKNCDTCEKK